MCYNFNSFHFFPYLNYTYKRLFLLDNYIPANWESNFKHIFLSTIFVFRNSAGLPFIFSLKKFWGFFCVCEISALKQCKCDQYVTQWKQCAIKGFTLQAVLSSFPKVTSGLLAGSSGSCAGGSEIADGSAICSTCSWLLQARSNSLPYWIKFALNYLLSESIGTLFHFFSFF